MHFPDVVSQMQIVLSYDEERMVEPFNGENEQYSTPEV
jgi:hypothetical protein